MFIILIIPIIIIGSIETIQHNKWSPYDVPQVEAAKWLKTELINIENKGEQTEH